MIPFPKSPLADAKKDARRKKGRKKEGTALSGPDRTGVGSHQAEPFRDMVSINFRLPGAGDHGLATPTYPKEWLVIIISGLF